MNLNDNQKLILDIGDLKAFHSPISTEVYESNFRILSETYGTIYDRGAQNALRIGPRIASLTLVEEGQRVAMQRGDLAEKDQPAPDAGATAFLKEIKRLTTILCPSQDGWDYLPVDAAINQKKIDAEDWKEVESMLVFFTCTYYSLPRKERHTIFDLMKMWEVATTVLSCEEYASSLPTSKEAKPGKKPASSVPV